MSIKELVSQIKTIDDERNKLNCDHYIDRSDVDAKTLFAQVYEDYIEDYAAEWGCNPTFDEVDLSLEQRAESLMWQLADALAFSFEEASAYFNQEILKGENS